MQIGLRTGASALALSSALAVFASPAAAVPANTSGQTAAAPKPLPAASWHGRPIRRPDRAGIAVMATHRSAAWAPLRFGAGYGRPNGSARVKQVQRLLNRIGYRPGPADGMYGPLTQSAVQWFQIKHSLRPTGAVDAATLALLGLRAHGASPAPMPTTASPQPAAPAVQPVTSGKPAAPAPAAATKPAPAAAGQHGSGGSSPTAVIVVAAAALALLVATLLLLLRRRRRARNAEPSSAPEAPSPPQPSPPVAPAPTVGAGRSLPARPSERVVAYTTGRNPRELRHQAETIERACSEHGWTLAQVVRERRNGNGHRPGLRFALEQLANGAGTRLVVCRVDDVGHNQKELAALLGWCARSGVDLVALDVGLDTGTRNGKRMARSLVAPGKRARVGRTLRRRRGKAPGVDGELAPS